MTDLHATDIGIAAPSMASAKRLEIKYKPKAHSTIALHDISYLLTCHSFINA